MQDISSVYPAARISVQKMALTPELQLSAREVRLCHSQMGTGRNHNSKQPIRTTRGGTATGSPPRGGSRMNLLVISSDQKDSLAECK